MKKAFTLIELLVVVLIIGILAAIALPQYQVAVGKAKFLELIAIGDAIHKAEEVYYLENGKYTNDIDALSLGKTEGHHLSQLHLQARSSNSYLRINYQGFGPYYIFYLDNPSSSSYRGRRECRVPSEQLTQTNKQICASLTGGQEYPVENYSFWIFQK